MGLRRARTWSTAPEPGGQGSAGAALGRAWLVASIAGLAAVAAVLAVLAGRLDGAPVSTAAELASLLPLLALASFLGLEFRVAGQGDRLDLFDPALAVALVCLPGPELVAAVAVAKTTLVVRRLPAGKLAYNVAQWACAAAAGSAVLAALREPGPPVPQDVLALLPALLVVAAVNATAVLLVLTAVGGVSLRHDGLAGLVRGTAVSTPVNLALGSAFVVVWTVSPAGRVVIPVVLMAVHLGTRGWAQRQAGSSRLLGLQRAGAALAGPDLLPDSTPRFLSELRRAFDCAGAELHLLPRDGTPAGSATRHAAGVGGAPERSAPLVTALLAAGEAVRLGAPATGTPEHLRLLAAAGWRDCLAAPVRVDDRVVGLLCTHDREGWEGFESAELQVLEAAAVVVGEAVRRQGLDEELREREAARAQSQTRWRMLAGFLELVPQGLPLGQTLEQLARALQGETGGAHCAVLVQVPRRPPVMVAPALPPRAGAALRSVLLEVLGDGESPGSPATLDLADPGGPGRDAAQDRQLAEAGVRTVRTWALSCSPEGGARGVLALCYPGAAATSPDGQAAEQHALLAADAARVGGLAVDHVLVQDRLAHQAAHDTLTDLPNRAVFVDRLGRALRSTQRRDARTSVLVLFLDLDRFKVVNDSLGHAAGDALLLAVARRLRTAVRPGDTVARFGGDEFTMLCEGIRDEAHALRIVRRVQAVLQRPFPLADTEIFATCSIGIALGSGQQTPEALVQAADAAMYKAKSRGGNTFELFDSALRERAVTRLGTQSALHRAVERQEFHVLYQPTVQLATGAVQGVEALVRWNRPEHGVVQPVDFIQMAEETGLIIPIGAYVLEQACHQAARWQHAGGRVHPSVSVNLSARQLTDPGLVPLVRQALQRSGADPASIYLEITESVLMSDVAASGTVLNELKGLGVQLFVDDFGTGYSSLSYLQRFPMDGLKLDRSFVVGLGSRATGAIVGSVVNLAHGLGLVAVAEGVETKAQADHLVDLGCDIAQGFHFGRPAPPEQVDLRLAAERERL